MPTVSRPLIALLLGTVAFFAVWMLALKPHGSSSGGSGATAYQPAINAAKQAVANSSHSADLPGGGSASAPPAGLANHPGSTATAARTTSTIPGHTTSTTAGHTTSTTAGHTTSTTAAASATHAASTTKHTAANAKAAVTLQRLSQNSAQRFKSVAAALEAKRVVALLFYNPTGSDDLAVKHELSLVPTHGKRVLKLAVPLSELSRYALVTQKVQINQTPTLVLINGADKASTIIGFADSFEISQRVQDALK